ncbi:NlpC/P60 family protein [Kitasatospora sp. NBC_01250]|uniref:C40 family peptidase n=1 Tax=Kitasatospora sp. NBC_01250 TaxID=2903571 RepID=UPI002E304B70|nr:NlpC/P60 family protein [Kitasatospora sp. NBC_01250]
MRAVRREHMVGTQPWLRAALRCGAVLAMAALVLPLAGQSAFAAGEPAPGASSAPSTAAGAPGADPLAQAEATLGPLLDKIHLLYQNAEAATEQYNATAQQLATQQITAAGIDSKVDAQQALVDQGIDVASEIASEQYRNGDLSGFGELLLTNDPYQAAHLAALLSAASRSQAEFIGQLKSDQASLQQLKKQSGDAVNASKALLAQQDQNKADISRQLATVEQVVSSLTGAQQNELQQLEQQQIDQAQLAFLASGALGQGERTPSAAGRKAVAYALAQLGKPYLWGGIGPEAYDCSGLTSQAWLSAGVQIPRTSQDQWAQLPHVPLNQLRPGDLVVYYESAEHVAMYIGGGLVVQAPHTGAFVRVSPIGMAPILGAVRPDPQNASDEAGGAWKVPATLQDAETITPIAPGPATAPGLPSEPPLPALLPVVPISPSAPPSAAKPSPGSSSPSGASPSGGSPSPAGPGPAAPSGSTSPTPSGSPSGTAPVSASPSGSTSPTPSGSPSGTASVGPSPSGSGSGSPSASPSGTAPVSGPPSGTPSDSPSH